VTPALVPIKLAWQEITKIYLPQRAESLSTTKIYKRQITGVIPELSVCPEEKREKMSVLEYMLFVS
jgi:hypothetical protein